MGFYPSGERHREHCDRQRHSVRELIRNGSEKPRNILISANARQSSWTKINNAFTEYSLVTAIIHANRKGHPSRQGLGYAILGTHHANGVRASRIRRAELPAGAPLYAWPRPRLRTRRGERTALNFGPPAGSALQLEPISAFTTCDGWR